MSRSIHVSSADFRKEFRFKHSTPEAREHALGKIIDKGLLKKAVKANTRIKRKSKKVGVAYTLVYDEDASALSSESSPSELAKEIVAMNERTGCG
jgi:hypothetical protein